MSRSLMCPHTSKLANKSDSTGPMTTTMYVTLLPVSCRSFDSIDTGVAPMHCSVTNPWLVSESERVRPLQDRRPYQETPSRCSTPVGLARGQPQYDLERSQCAGARRVSKLRIPISHWPLQLVPCGAFVADGILAEPTQSGLEAGSS